MVKRRILVEDDWDLMQGQVDFCVAELLLRSGLIHTHDWSEITGKPELFSGNYNDLDNLPSLFDGDYNSLSNLPSIPAAQIQSDWTQSSSGALDFIKNKPSIPAPQVQSDWTQTNNTQVDFIKNKPVLSFTTPSRTINTAFQISATNDAFVAYAIPIVSAATLILGSRGRLTLQYADNSGMSTNLVNLLESEFGTASGLIVTSYGTLFVCGKIPKGKYVRLVTTNVLGTPTYGSVKSQEVLQ